MFLARWPPHERLRAAYEGSKRPGWAIIPILSKLIRRDRSQRAEPGAEETAPFQVIGRCLAMESRFVYSMLAMTLYEYYVVYPDGDTQEIDGALRIDDLVDLNGRRLPLPLSTPRMIVYRVVRIRHREERGLYTIYHDLELVGAAELLGYC